MCRLIVSPSDKPVGHGGLKVRKIFGHILYWMGVREGREVGGGEVGWGGMGWVQVEEDCTIYIIAY